RQLSRQCNCDAASAIAAATSLAITPLPGASEELLTVRILKIGLASLYALGALSLVGGLRRKT
ncbi:MAG: hypothetical protein V4466_11900, partial [Pseudomonadota bacterium]